MRGSPAAGGVSSLWWNWRLGGFAWVFALVMLMEANTRFDVEFEKKNVVARRWRLAGILLLVLTAILGLLALLLYMFAFFLARLRTASDA